VPYWPGAGKVHGKTVTRRLTAQQATACQQWIDNDRQLHAVIYRDASIAARALALVLQVAKNDPRG
jgi:hypothetical protein